jgi:hypothetical protein
LVADQNQLFDGFGIFSDWSPINRSKFTCLMKMNPNMTVNTCILLIVIVGVDSYRGAVDLQIGDNFASITEPKLHFLDLGLIYIETNAHSTACWEDILPERDFDGTVLRGFSDDP